MRTSFLFALLFLGIGSAVAAPCQILPYQNQCQGSNYWPAPSGWGPSYNSTTCQPAMPSAVSPTPTATWHAQGELPMVWRIGSTTFTTPQAVCTYLGRGYQSSQDGAGCGGVIGGARSASCYGASPVWAYPTCPNGAWAGCSLNYFTNTYNSTCPIPGATTCPAGYALSGTGNLNTANPGLSPVYSCVLQFPAQVKKPPDGVCTAKWANSSQTVLQKDPLDPDCTPTSCALDGACSLR
jgi:hypothetical protein